jgi:hypothetical protein
MGLAVTVFSAIFLATGGKIAKRQAANSQDL